MEIFWTGLASLCKRDYKLVANTSIWMFFIYGMAVFMEPVCDAINELSVIVRGGVYVLCIFVVEYITGTLLKTARICPWDYSDSKLNIHGIIRLDYAPVWFVAGLIFEQVHFLLNR